MNNSLFAIAVTSVLSSTVLAESEHHLSLWFHARSTEELSFIHDQVDRFHQIQNEIRIDALALPETGFTQHVIEQDRSGNGPDLIYFHTGNLSYLAWSGTISPLNDLIASNVLDNTLPSVRAQGTYPADSQLYALAPTDSTPVLYGNRALLADTSVEVPTTLDQAWTRLQFENLLAELVEHGQRWPLELGLYQADPEWYMSVFSPIFYSQGADLISRIKWDAHLAANSLFVRDVDDVLSEWFDHQWVVPASKMNGRFYRRQNSALSIATLQHYERYKAELGDNLVVLPMPVLGPYPATTSGNYGWSITQSSEQSGMAARFIEFALSDAEVTAMSKRTLDVPGTHSAIQQSSLYGEGGPLALVVEQLNRIATPRPFHPAYPVIRDSFAQAMANVVAGEDLRGELSVMADRVDGHIRDADGFPPFNNL
ncbi:ABC transporter substrate-binding protein [Saccharospirillum salsuginis]|uniref:Sugar ABC transporter substrate-binding protein n=1 Tax=Saccharospirillum salsuginis TaxID=418750 RepID=A0A918KMU0_9GAMM|nr:extracellular solute-binding protein [Saccharospirillum salsuginis]GGX66909.1 sugar ABC transporter substrate-binding protein [Saccharospirillum salsuginis]